jgi:hypothetical protein
MKFCMVGFSYVYIRSLAGGRMCSILIVCLFTLHDFIKLQGTKKYTIINLCITQYVGFTDYAECSVT